MMPKTLKELMTMWMEKQEHPLNLSLNELASLLKESLSKEFELDDDGLEQDALTHLVYKVILDTVEYTNRDYNDITMHMVYLMYYVVCDKFYSDTMIKEAPNGAMVKSIREGDVTVSQYTLLERLQYIQKQDGVMDDYRHLLNKWRKVRS